MAIPMSPLGTKVILESDGLISIVLPGQSYNGGGVEIQQVSGLILDFPIDGLLTAHIKTFAFSDFNQLKGFVPESKEPVFYLMDRVNEDEIIDLIEVVENI